MSENKFVNVQINGKGKVLLRVTDDDSRWGFYLTDGESVWDGGFGIADNKKTVPTKRTSKAVEDAKHAIINGYGYPCFSRYEFVNEAGS